MKFAFNRGKRTNARERQSLRNCNNIESIGCPEIRESKESSFYFRGFGGEHKTG